MLYCTDRLDTIHRRRVKKVGPAFSALPTLETRNQCPVLQEAVALDADHRLLTAFRAFMKAVIDPIEFFEFIQGSVSMK